MRNLLRVLWIGIVETIIIVVTLISIVQMDLPIFGRYIVYGITALLIPLALLLLYHRIWGRETLAIIPISLIVAALISLGVSLYSYYGDSSFSNMFNELMYFIYFLPSVIYCGMSWVIFAIMARLSKEPRRREQ